MKGTVYALCLGMKGTIYSTMFRYERNCICTMFRYERNCIVLCIGMKGTGNRNGEKDGRKIKEMSFYIFATLGKAQILRINWACCLIILQNN